MPRLDAVMADAKKLDAAVAGGQVKEADLSDDGRLALALARGQVTPDKLTEQGRRALNIEADPNLLQRGYRGLEHVVAKAGQYSPVDVAQGALSKLSGGLVPQPKPLVTNEQAQRASEIVTPMLLTAPLTAGGSAAGTVASQALGKGATLLPAAGRVAGAAAGGGLTGAARGKDAVSEAVLSGLGGAGGEAAGMLLPKAPGAVRALWERWTPWGQAAAQAEKVAASATKATASEGAKETARAAKRMVQDTEASLEAARLAQSVKLPGLDAKTSADLYKLSLGGEGRKILNDRFGTVVKDLDATLKQGRITGIRVPELGNEAMTVREAVDALQMVGKGIGRGVPGERSVLQNMAAMDYSKARQALVQRLNDVSPGSGDRLGQALTESSRGRAYLKLLEKSFNKDGLFDPDKFASALNRGAGRLAEKFGKDWTQMESAMTGGRALPIPVRPGIGPAPQVWRPTPPAPVPWQVPTAAQVAATVVGAQEGPRETVVGGGGWILEHLPLLGRHGWHSDLIYEGMGGDGG